METVDTGLDGIPVCSSDISLTTLDANENPVLLYRGYSIYDLVKGLFEESVYLILEKELPDKIQLEKFSQELRENGPLDARISEHIRTYPQDVHMMDYLLTALSFARILTKIITIIYGKNPRKTLNLSLIR